MSTLGVGIFQWRLRQMMRRFKYRLFDRLGLSSAVDFTALEAKIRHKPGPIRVGFLVCSRAKWSAQALFDALSADPDFDPFFILTLSDTALRSPPEARRDSFQTLHGFFEGIGDVRERMYCADTDRMGLRYGGAADVVFVQQPWGMQSFPRDMLGAKLTAYIHYGFPVIQNDDMQFGLAHFHPYLWCHYVPSAAHASQIAASPLRRAGDVVVSGHPKLDPYLRPSPAREQVTAWPHAAEANRKRVIYAPHHSILGKGLGLGTFDWSGAAMLDLAQANPAIDFVYKPHPNLALEVERAGPDMQARFRTFLSRWQAMDHCAVFEGGQYFDLFRTSDLMITDCGSFLAEYLPSDRPLIRLIHAGSAQLNAAGQAISHGFYEAHDASGLRELFDQVARQDRDDLSETRQDHAAALRPVKPSSHHILEHLREKLRG